MSNLFILLKSLFINNTGINSLSKGISSSKEKGKLLFTAITLILIGVLIAFMSTCYSIGLAIVLKPMGYLDLILLVAVIFSAILSFMTTIYKAQGTLFSSKDYDLLMSLPIKNSTILASKILSLMSINYIGIALVMIPAATVYFIYNGTLTLTYFLILIVGLIFIPMLPIVVASIVAMLITFISSRFKHKNISTIIASMIFFLTIMIVSLKSQNYINEFINNSDSIVKAIASIYPPAAYFKDSLINNDLISLVKLMLISIIPFIIFIFIFSKSFKSINSKMAESYKNGNYKVKDLEISSQLKALVAQELRRYFATPIYVLNTAIGAVMIVVASIATLFISKETFIEILGYPGMENVIPMMILAFLIFSIGLTCTTNCSISLEGNRLWILKSLPIEVEEIFKAKILMNLIITIPATLISNVVFFIGLKYEVKYLVFNTLISILFAITSAIVGIIINLNFPKMEWSNPTTVVKQSTSVLISILFTMMSIIVFIGIVILSNTLLDINNIVFVLSIILVLLLIILITSVKVLKLIGVKKFNSI